MSEKNTAFISCDGGFELWGKEDREFLVECSCLGEMEILKTIFYVDDDLDRSPDDKRDEPSVLLYFYFNHMMKRRQLPSSIELTISEAQLFLGLLKDYQDGFVSARVLNKTGILSVETLTGKEKGLSEFPVVEISFDLLKRRPLHYSIVIEKNSYYQFMELFEKGLDAMIQKEKEIRGKESK